MFAPELKQEISNKIQEILQGVKDSELPKGEINFILHVDGLRDCSWANIRNNSMKDMRLPSELIQNMTFVYRETK